jgi:hypothetical protein
MKIMTSGTDEKFGDMGNSETPQPETPQPSPPTLEEQARERVRQALLRYRPRKPKRWR